MQIILLVHIVTTLFMTSICWFVQVVHYPLFYEMKFSDLIFYERKNVLFTAILAIPIMMVELLSGFYLLYVHQDYLHSFNVIFIIIVALSTFLFQAPLHLKLMENPSSELVTKLIRTNWIRTISWTIRCGIVIHFCLSFL